MSEKCTCTQVITQINSGHPSLRDSPNNSKRSIANGLLRVHRSGATGERWRWTGVVVVGRSVLPYGQWRHKTGCCGTVQWRVFEIDWCEVGTGRCRYCSSMPLTRNHRSIRKQCVLLPVRKSSHLLYSHHHLAGRHPLHSCS